MWLYNHKDALCSIDMDFLFMISDGKSITSFERDSLETDLSCKLNVIFVQSLIHISQNIVWFLLV